LPNEKQKDLLMMGKFRDELKIGKSYALKLSLINQREFKIERT
jgi:hypothetical protein